jgi:hypothetical protein
MNQEQLELSHGADADESRDQRKEWLSETLSMIRITNDLKVDPILPILDEAFKIYPELFDRKSECSRVSEGTHSSPQQVLRAVVRASNPEQLNRLLESLYRNKLYEFIGDYVFAVKFQGQTLKILHDFYLNHLKDSSLLEQGGHLLNTMTAEQSKKVFEALKKWVTTLEHPWKDLRKFWVNIASGKLLEHHNEQLTDFVYTLPLVGEKNFVRKFNTSCFARFAQNVLPFSKMEDRPKLMEKLSLSPLEVCALLATSDYLGLDYLNAISRSLENYKSRNNRAPGRTKKVIDRLKTSYKTDSWSAIEQDLFCDALANPKQHYTRVFHCESMRVVAALLEQFALSDQTIDYVPRLLDQHVLRLLGKMDANQAGRLLLTVCNNFTSLRPCVAQFIAHSQKMSGPVVEGFAPVYTKLMLDSTVESSLILRSDLMKLGGVMLEKMSAQDVSAFFENITRDYLADGTPNTIAPYDIEALFLSCRQNGQLLPDEVARQLSKLFLEAKAKTKEKLKGINLPKVYEHLGARLLPLMTDPERVELLNDPELKVNLSIVQALLPEGVTAPVAPGNEPIAGDLSAQSEKPSLELSDACVRALVLRSAEASKNEVAHCMRVFATQKENDLIVEVFTKFREDQKYGIKLEQILFEEHLSDFLPLFIARIDVNKPEAQEYRDLLSLIYLANPTVLRGVLSKLLSVVKDGSDEAIKIKAKTVALDVFSNLLKDRKSTIFQPAETQKDKTQISVFGLIVNSLLTKLFFDGSPDYPKFKVIIEAMLNSPVHPEEVLNLLKAALGVDASRHTACITIIAPKKYNIRPEIIRTILQSTKLTREQIEAIHEHGSNLLAYCVMLGEFNRERTIEAINLLLKFLCTLKPEYINDKSKDFDHLNPIHLAARLVADIPREGTLEVFKLLLSQVKMVGSYVLRVLVKAEDKSQETLEALRVVFEHAKKNNYTIFQNDEHQKFLPWCVSVKDPGELNTDIFQLLISQGLKPTLTQVDIALKNFEKNGQKTKQLLDTLSEQFPDLAIEHAIQHNNPERVEEIVSMNIKTGKFNLDQLRSFLEKTAETGAKKPDSVTTQLKRTFGKAYLVACSDLLPKPSEACDIARRNNCLDKILEVKDLLNPTCAPQIVAMIIQMIKQNTNGKADPKLDSFLKEFELTDLFVAKKYASNRGLFSSGPKYNTSLGLAYLRLVDSNEKRFLAFMQKCYDTKHWPRDQATQTSYTEFMSLVDELNSAKSPLSKLLCNEVCSKRLEAIREHRPTPNP